MRFYKLLVNDLTVSMKLQDNAIYLIDSMSDEVGIPQYFIDEVSSWCDENDCGVQAGWRSFQFENSDQLTMFLLKWT